MQIFHNLFNQMTDQPTVLTLGMFDGVHLGHQKLIRSLINSARANNCMAGLITFFPHPRKVLSCRKPSYLTSNQEKLAILEQLGLDLVVIQEFSTEIAKVRATRFVDLLLENLHMQELWIGHDFALGYRREGDAAYLKALGIVKGFAVHAISDPVTLNGQNISSSRIREALRLGDMTQVNNCLGRQFKVFGKVMSYRRCQINCGMYFVHGICQQEFAVPKSGLYPARILVCQSTYDTNVRFETREHGNDSLTEFEFTIPEDIDILGGIQFAIELKATNPFVHQNLQRITEEIKVALG